MCFRSVKKHTIITRRAYNKNEANLPTEKRKARVYATIQRVHNKNQFNSPTEEKNKNNSKCPEKKA